ncbi:hypothetical protein H5410_060516 [Solanum commersonii]|uniref:Uncharacterized protein n=1 Tax=Solanum commersonii TaxID=4109 RepID=A0A9J5W6T0_SOLCO|nr:hypothetical protein H5410_060516 [Solanum commersonii]
MKHLETMMAPFFFKTSCDRHALLTTNRVQVTFVKERLTPQCGTFRREFGFSRTPMWVPDAGWETKKKRKSKAFYLGWSWTLP